MPKKELQIGDFVKLRYSEITREEYERVQAISNSILVLLESLGKIRKEFWENMERRNPQLEPFQLIYHPELGQVEIKSFK